MELTYNIKKGSTVKLVLSQELNLSRRMITRIYHEQGILLNGRLCTLTSPVADGDVLVVVLSDKDAVQSGYRTHTPDILYEDEDIIIVNKPAGLPSHPSKEYPKENMGTYLQEYRKDSSFVIRTVGRLDKDVSGCLCFAKSSRAVKYYSQNDHMEKTYTAVIAGKMEQDAGTLTYSLSKVKGKKIYGFDEHGAECITHYRTLETLPYAQVISIHIETGRTHQIRAGFAGFGHPLVGDRLYGDKSREISRCALHCASVSFIRQTTGKRIEISSKLPEDMQRLILHLQAKGKE